MGAVRVRSNLSDIASTHLVQIMGEISHISHNEYKHHTISEASLLRLEDMCKVESDILKRNNFSIADWTSYGFDGSFSAHLDYCSKLTREAEIAVLNDYLRVRPVIKQYMNRLSDFFFISARSCSDKLLYHVV